MCNLLKVVVSKQFAVCGNLFDAQQFITHSVQSQIQIVATTLQCIQVVTQFLRFHLVKLQVGDKDNTAIEVKSIWHTLTAQHIAVAQPTDFTLLATVQSAFEQVQCHIVQQNTVAVIEHQHTVGIRIFVQGSIQTQSRCTAFDNFCSQTLACNLIQQCSLFNFLLYTKALAYTWRATDNHSTNVAVSSGLGHLSENVKTLTNAFNNLFVSFNSLCHLFSHRTSILQIACYEFISRNTVNFDSNSIRAIRKSAVVANCDMTTSSSSFVLFYQLKSHISHRFVAISAITEEDSCLTHLLVPCCCLSINYSRMVIYRQPKSLVVLEYYFLGHVQLNLQTFPSTSMASASRFNSSARTIKLQRIQGFLNCGIADSEVTNAIADLFCSSIKTCLPNNNAKLLGLFETLDVHR